MSLLGILILLSLILPLVVIGGEMAFRPLRRDLTVNYEDNFIAPKEAIISLDMIGATPKLKFPEDFGFDNISRVRLCKNKDGSLLIIPTHRYIRIS